MPGVKEFSDNPALFLKRNLVRQTILDPRGLNENKIGWFFVVQAQVAVKRNDLFVSQTATRSDRATGKVYDIKYSKDKVENSVQAYWLPYSQNQTKSIMVGMDASLVFTPTVDGCTIGVGSDNGQGGRTLCHVNMGGWRNNSAQETKARSTTGQNSAILSANQYQQWDPWEKQPNNVIKTTVWGERDKLAWTFFYQSWRKVGERSFEWLGYRTFPKA